MQRAGHWITERRPCLSEKLISHEAKHEKRNVMQLLHTADNKDIRNKRLPLRYEYYVLGVTFQRR